jgi:hypothetical protein
MKYSDITEALERKGFVIHTLHDHVFPKRRVCVTVNLFSRRVYVALGKRSGHDSFTLLHLFSWDSRESSFFNNTTPLLPRRATGFFLMCEQGVPQMVGLVREDDMKIGLSYIGYGVKKIAGEIL